MKNYRVWGKPPYIVAVVHGGPGVPGYMAPVARELAKTMGVLEPFQTQYTIDGQASELANVIREQAAPPVTLIGHSWGAALSYLTAAKYPELVKKLILIGTSPIIAKKGPRPDAIPAYIERFSESERADFFGIVNNLWDDKTEDKNAEFGKLCYLIEKAETYEALPAKDEVIEYQFGINKSIGQELNNMIESETLIEAGKKIKCPVTVIQGDYDTNSTAEVKEALSLIVKDFKFVLLEKCGHYPWLEKFARDEFFRILKSVI
jgi:pimeloyl-ACP methyl ester carboxylesterase